MQPNRKPPSRVIGIESSSKFNRPKAYPPEPTAPTANNPNCYTRRAFINMAIAGATFRGILRAYKSSGATEANVMATFAEEMVRGGSLDRKKEAA
jgi:hypothetical protein